MKTKFYSWLFWKLFDARFDWYYAATSGSRNVEYAFATVRPPSLKRWLLYHALSRMFL